MKYCHYIVILFLSIFCLSSCCISKNKFKNIQFYFNENNSEVKWEYDEYVGAKIPNITTFHWIKSYEDNSLIIKMYINDTVLLSYTKISQTQKAKKIHNSFNLDYAVIDLDVYNIDNKSHRLQYVLNFNDNLLMLNDIAKQNSTLRFALLHDKHYRLVISSFISHNFALEDFKLERGYYKMDVYLGASELSTTEKKKW